MRVPVLYVHATRRLCWVAAAGLLATACDKSTAPAKPGPPAQIEVTSGGGQSALAGTALSQPIGVTVRDAKGMAVPSVSVRFAVAAGGGSITPSTVVTDAAGLAVGVNWTLGTRGGDQTVTATVDTVVKRISATVRSSYTITLRFFGPAMAAEAEAAFVNAVARIQAAIVGQISTVNLQGANLANCGVSGLTGILSENTTGLIIYAAVAPIDGPGKILAQAGPCYVRDQSVLPAVGVMQFDQADIQNYITTGRFESIVLHEMNHVVGFGTIWGDKNLVQNAVFGNDTVPSANTNPRFMGFAAIASCTSAGSTANHCTAASGVALEQCGGLGTADGHWREVFTTNCTGTNRAPVGGTPAFDTELMTGYVEATGVSMPWSAMSISSFQDLGYTVNLLAADPYTVPSLLSLARLQAEAGAVDHPTEVVLRPRFRIGNGRIEAIKR
jgi:hypothetical protein